MTTLQNEYVIAKIDNKGAELTSFVLRMNHMEYMWNADPRYWAKHSPVLFPIVGSLKEDTYFYKGEQYHLPRHGFARDKVFAVNEISPAEVLFTLESDESTLAVYPFYFNLGIRYRLTGQKLICSYEVLNTGAESMYFSIGGHPAFKVPIIPGTNYSDYYIQFSHPEQLVQYKLSNGLLSGETQKIRVKFANTFMEETEDMVLPLEHHLFYDDAIVIKDPGSHFVILGNDLIKNGVQVNFESFPYLGIWAARNAPFVCIEPWCGLADNMNHNQQLVDKEGINSLEAGEKWKRSWTAAIF